MTSNMSVKLHSLAYTYDPSDTSGNGYGMYVASGIKDDTGIV